MSPSYCKMTNDVARTPKCPVASRRRRPEGHDSAHPAAANVPTQWYSPARVVAPTSSKDDVEVDAVVATVQSAGGDGPCRCCTLPPCSPI